MQVAVIAGQGEVFRLIPATMLPGDDVLNVQRVERVRALWESAVFATIACSLAHERPRLRIHALGCCPGSEALAGAGLEDGDEVSKPNKRFVFLPLVFAEATFRIGIGEPLDTSLHLLTRPETEKRFRAGAVEAFTDGTEDILHRAGWWYVGVVHERECSEASGFAQVQRLGEKQVKRSAATGGQFLVVAKDGKE